MTSPSAIPPQAPGLSPEQLRQWAEARARNRKIRRAILTAQIDYWTVGLFAALTLVGSLASFSWPGLLVGIAMGIVTFVEYQGVRDLKKLDPTALKRLAWNQAFFGCALFLYAIFSLIRGLSDPGQATGLVAAQVPPDLLGSSAIESINAITKIVIIAMYGTLALVAIFVQGGTALFYKSREKHLRAYVEQTPQWILDAQRAGLPL